MQVSSPLYPAVVLLSAGVLSFSLARFSRVSPIICFFILGAVIGSHGLGLVDNHTSGLHFMAELGVCFLLFDVGLHLSLKELRQSLKGLILTGLLQSIITSLMIGLAVYSMGLSWETSLSIGAILSLSSTALVLKILGDHREQTSPAGKKATEILVFQDLFAIVLLVLFAGGGSESGLSGVLLSIGKMLFAAVVMVSAGRILLKPFFALLISLKNDEVFTAFALLLVLFTSWVTESLGLSLALGAFLGGLALSESSYAYLVRNEVAPFRGLLLSLFFLTVGMSLDTAMIVSEAALLCTLLSAYLLTKAAANWIALRLSGTERSSATRLALLLSQGSEFAFVLLGGAVASGMLTDSQAGLAAAVTGLSLAITPLTSAIGCRMSRSVCSIQHEDKIKEEEVSEVIIVEFDDYGREIAGVLNEHGINYIGHDRDYERLTYAKSRGFNVYFSDFSRPRTISRASTGKVTAVVCLVEDDQIIEALIKGLKQAAPNVPIIAATSSPQRLDLLYELGLQDAFLKSHESMPVLLERLFRFLKIPEQKARMMARNDRSTLSDDVLPRLLKSENQDQISLAA